MMPSDTGAKSRILAAAIAAVLSTATPAVHAAEGQETIAEVTVTATRRELSIQEVPLNIAAVGSAAIEEQGLSDLGELARTVPGLFVIDG